MIRHAIVTTGAIALAVLGLGFSAPAQAAGCPARAGISYAECDDQGEAYAAAWAAATEQAGISNAGGGFTWVPMVEQEGKAYVGFVRPSYASSGRYASNTRGYKTQCSARPEETGWKGGGVALAGPDPCATTVAPMRVPSMRALQWAFYSNQQVARAPRTIILLPPRLIRARAVVTAEAPVRATVVAKVAGRIRVAATVAAVPALAAVTAGVAQGLVMAMVAGPIRVAAPDLAQGLAQERAGTVAGQGRRLDGCTRSRARPSPRSLLSSRLALRAPRSCPRSRASLVPARVADRARRRPGTAASMPASSTWPVCAAGHCCNCSSTPASCSSPAWVLSP